MSWGMRITVLYLSFVALIVTLVVLCFGQKVELVSKDYYKQELQYQSRIEAIDNANALKSSIDYQLLGNEIILKAGPEFVKAGFKGEVVFFRPSDSSKDFKVDLKFDANGEQKIGANKLSHGIYNLQIAWNSKGKNYFKEQVINIK